MYANMPECVRNAVANGGGGGGDGAETTMMLPAERNAHDAIIVTAIQYEKTAVRRVGRWKSLCVAQLVCIAPVVAVSAHFACVRV